jgi:hypothetical protein
MVKGSLIMALDGRGIGGEPVNRAEVAEDGAWTVTHTGPNYHNVYQITEYDAKGLQQLIILAGEAPGQE